VSFLYEHCTLKIYDKNILANCNVFDCGNEDLNEFFAKDVLKYNEE
jgi:hypothetical protein